MTSMHPTETPPLGWLVPCLAVGDLQASLAFYAKLDLLPFGGDPEEGWTMLRNRAIEIHLFSEHIERDLVNFRGGDPAQVRAGLAERGLNVEREFGERSFSYFDPDGRSVFFDGTEEEARRYAAGEPLTAEISGDVQDGTGLDLGNLSWCMACKDLPATSRFYQTLGLVSTGGDPDHGWEILARRDHVPAPGTRSVEAHISLFCGIIPRDMLNFRGPDVGALAGQLSQRGVDLGDGVQGGEDGGESLTITDPDDRPIFFDTTPPERLY